MNQAIGESIIFAVGVALSPLPIIGVILMLLSRRSGANSLSFLAGWILGIAGALTAVIAIGSAIGLTSHNAQNGTSTFKVVLGVILLIMGVRRVRRHPASGETPKQPKWLQSIESITPGKALGTGVALAAINPKNLILIIGGGLAIAGAAHDTLTSEIIAGAIFTVLAASTVLLPVVAYNVARQPATKLLSSMRDWLATNANAVLGTVFALLGVLLIGKGIGGF